MSDPHSASALAGATIVITRAATAAASLRARARALGGKVVSLPGLSVRAAGDASSARQMLHAAKESDAAAIFTSPAAVRFTFRLMPAFETTGQVAVFAVGAGTQRALTRHRIRALAPSGRSDSEALLALPALTQVRGRHIVLIGAPGGRDLIESTLAERGARVESIAVYERALPRLTKRHYDALAQAADPLILLISSGAALANLVALLPAALLARLRHQTLIVSSARLAALARDNGFEHVFEAASALPADLLDAAQKALARHRL